MKRYETVSNGTTRNTSHLSVHLHNRTHRQIGDMADQLSMSHRQIIEIAVDRFWLDECDGSNLTVAPAPATDADIAADAALRESNRIANGIASNFDPDPDVDYGTAADDHDGAHPADLAAFGAL